MSKPSLADKVRAGYPNSWWYRDKVRNSSNGWPQVYEVSRYHCVYCRKDISTSVDEICASTIDHLVPQHLFPETGAHDLGPNHLSNLVTACAVCNSLKGGWAPAPSSRAWDSRRTYIGAVRKHLESERANRAKRYASHIGKGKEMVEIWDWTAPGECDFA